MPVHVTGHRAASVSTNGSGHNVVALNTVRVLMLAAVRGVLTDSDAWAAYLDMHDKTDHRLNAAYGWPPDGPSGSGRRKFDELVAKAARPRSMERSVPA